MALPLPGEQRCFELEWEGEENWKHMGRTVSVAVSPLARFEHEFDCGTPTELQR